MSPKTSASTQDLGEKKGGLTTEERDQIRRSLGIIPPAGGQHTGPNRTPTVGNDVRSF